MSYELKRDFQQVLSSQMVIFIVTVMSQDKFKVIDLTKCFGLKCHVIFLGSIQFKRRRGQPFI
jgi:hypothetical protein